MIITTKNTEFNGLFGGIEFKKGEAKVEKLSESDKAWYISKGCTIIEEETEEVAEVTAEVKEEVTEEVKEAKKSKK